MPLKLNVGLARKIGQPDYGSLCASCHVEVELDQSLINHDLEEFHRRVRNAFVACSQAVGDELTRQQTNGGKQPAETPVAQSAQNGNGNGSSQAPAASQKQVDYMLQLAKQVTGLGPQRLELLTSSLYSKSTTSLTSLEASGVIDTLKAIKEGRMVLAEVLDGVAA
jgi:hypothetical protein